MVRALNVERCLLVVALGEGSSGSADIIIMVPRAGPGGEGLHSAAERISGDEEGEVG